MEDEKNTVTPEASKTSTCCTRSSDCRTFVISFLTVVIVLAVYHMNMRYFCSSCPKMTPVCQKPPMPPYGFIPPCKDCLKGDCELCKDGNCEACKAVDCKGCKDGDCKPCKPHFGKKKGPCPDRAPAPQPPPPAQEI